MDIFRIRSVAIEKFGGNDLESSANRPILGQVVGHPPGIEAALDRKILFVRIDGIHPLRPFVRHECERGRNGKQQEQPDTDLMLTLEP
jgi:hypothetical protein